MNENKKNKNNRINLKIPWLVAAALVISSRVSYAAVDVATVGAHNHIPGLLAPWLDSVPADAARSALNHVLGQVFQEHRVSVLAKVLVVHGVRAPGETSLGTAKAGNFLHLLVILTLALQSKR